MPYWPTADPLYCWGHNIIHPPLSLSIGVNPSDHAFSDRGRPRFSRADLESDRQITAGPPFAPLSPPPPNLTTTRLSLIAGKTTHWFPNRPSSGWARGERRGGREGRGCNCLQLWMREGGGDTCPTAKLRQAYKLIKTQRERCWCGHWRTRSKWDLPPVCKTMTYNDI